MSFRATPSRSSSPGPAAELPGAYLYELASLCARWGVKPDALLAGTGWTLDRLKEPTARLPLAECGALIDRARSLTGQPALAFAMGLHMRLSWHGFLGFAAMTASTVREAAELAERFSLTRTAAFGLSIYVEGETASLVLEERVPLGALREFVVITLLVGIAQIARDVTGQPLTGVAECAFAEPPYARPMLSATTAQSGTMRFGAPAHRLVFDAAVLDLPLVTADPVAMQLARAQCDRELAAIVEEGSFLGKVRVAVGRGGEGTRSLEEVARKLHLSSRTLKRRLADHGT